MFDEKYKVTPRTSAHDDSQQSYVARRQSELSEGVALLAELAEKLPPKEGALAYARLSNAIRKIGDIAESEYGWKLTGDIGSECILVRSNGISFWATPGFSAGGETMAFADLGKVRLVNLLDLDEKGNPADLDEARLPYNKTPNMLVFSPDGNMLAASGHSGLIVSRMIDSAEGPRLETFVKTYVHGWVRSAAFDQNGDLLATASNQLPWAPHNLDFGMLNVFDLTRLERVECEHFVDDTAVQLVSHKYSEPIREVVLDSDREAVLFRSGNRINMVSIRDKGQTGAPSMIASYTPAEGEQLVTMRGRPESAELMVEVAIPWQEKVEIGEGEFILTRHRRVARFLSLDPERRFQENRAMELPQTPGRNAFYDPAGNYAVIQQQDGIGIYDLMTVGQTAGRIATVPAGLFNGNDIKFAAFSRDASKLALATDYSFAIIGPQGSLVYDDFADIRARLLNG